LRPEATVAEHLLQYVGIPGLRFQEAPTPLDGGWETYTYRLEFEPHRGLPARLQGPLVLRVYATEQGAARARHEFAAQSFVHGHGFPSPRPVLLVDDGEPFGGPFLLMERLRGRTLLDVLQARPWSIWRLAARMAALHARLHQMSTEGFPDCNGDFLDRSLDGVRARIVAYGLEGLRPGLDWLVNNRPHRTGIPRVLHLDWHPLNLIYSDDGPAAIDWTEADVGDRHADVATTLLELQCLPPPPPAWWARPFVPIVRGVLARHYLRSYRRRLPIQERRLAYYGAWAALRRLANYGRWLSAGPGSNGCKPSALRRVSPAQCAEVCAYFARHSGVEVKLEWEGW
jgi:aminoglycoside phosphotransferase (APT) family kinase protein